MRKDPIYDGLIVALTEQVSMYRYRNGEYPAAILAESDAYFRLMSDEMNILICKDGKAKWRGMIPLKHIADSGMAVYLCGNPIRFCAVQELGPAILFSEEDV